jgi:hypothetical protein
MQVRVLVKERERETQREGSLTGNAESYIRHAKEGFGNEAFLTFQRLEGSHTEASKRHVMEGMETEHFFYRTP